MRRAIFSFIAALLLASPCLAQTVQQAGPWTQGHAPSYSIGGGSQPFVTDGGPASGSGANNPLREGLYVAPAPAGGGLPPYSASGTGPSGTNWCDYDGPPSSGNFHYLCLSPNAQGSGLITYGAVGSAKPQDLIFSINGHLFDPLSNPTPGSSFPGDVRLFGCVADGVTDQTACINAALVAYQGCIIIPPTTSGFYVAGTITVPLCMQGLAFTPSQASVGYANTSVILCNNQASIPCVVASRPVKGSVNIHDLSIIGAGATPVPGSIGFQQVSGYNLILTNVQAANFGTCAKFGPTYTNLIEPISAVMTNTFFSRCLNHYVVDDGIPELYFKGGRWGEGTADYASADDFMYITKTTASGGGGGPNTIVLDSMQLNTGKSVGCPFRWGGFSFTQGGTSANAIINSHIEVPLGSGYTGGKSLGTFCVDSTVPRIPQYTVTGSSFSEDGTPKVMPMFNFDASVPYGNDSHLVFQGNEIQMGTFNLLVHNELFDFGPTFIGNWFFSPATFTSGSVSATGTLADNTFFGGYTIDGPWADLQLDHNLATSFTDTATGLVYQSGQPPRVWTPQVTIGGSAVGITTSKSAGLITRTPGGGYLASYSIVLTSKGVATGGVKIENIPLICGLGLGSQTLNVAQNFSGLVGSPFAQTASGDTKAFIEEFAATGQTILTDANLTNTTALGGDITCGTVQ